MHAVLHERPLEPPLRGDIVHLKFSDDGRHALAQDDSTIYVLSREPFEVLFQIDAEGARPAQFTPDSREIVFDTFGLRVERWEIASRRQVAVHELHVNGSCVQSTLARDARFWACIDQTLTILLLDVPTGEIRYSRRWGHALSPQELYLLSVLETLSGSFSTGVQAEVFELTFSPDSRYLVIGNFAADIVVETETRKEADLTGAVRRAFRQSFSFLGSNRLVTVDPKRPERSAVVRLPSGQTEKHVTLGGRVTAATRGEFVMIRPIKEWPVGLVDLATGQVVQASRHSAFDVFDRLRLSVQPNGDLGLYVQGSSQPVAVAALPRARLGFMTAADVSADLKWLAVSGRERGAVWNVESGSRTTLIAGFSGAYLAADGALYADFPPRKKSDGANSLRAVVEQAG